MWIILATCLQLLKIKTETKICSNIMQLKSIITGNNPRNKIILKIY